MTLMACRFGRGRYPLSPDSLVRVGHLRRRAGFLARVAAFDHGHEMLDPGRVLEIAAAQSPPFDERVRIAELDHMILERLPLDEHAVAAGLLHRPVEAEGKAAFRSKEQRLGLDRGLLERLLT